MSKVDKKKRKSREIPAGRRRRLEKVRDEMEKEGVCAKI
jgi:hypothetical protein